MKSRVRFHSPDISEDLGLGGTLGYKALMCQANLIICPLNRGLSFGLNNSEQQISVPINRNRTTI